MNKGQIQERIKLILRYYLKFDQIGQSIDVKNQGFW